MYQSEFEFLKGRTKGMKRGLPNSFLNMIYLRMKNVAFDVIQQILWQGLKIVLDAISNFVVSAFPRTMGVSFYSAR